MYGQLNGIADLGKCSILYPVNTVQVTGSLYHTLWVIGVKIILKGILSQL